MNNYIGYLVVNILLLVIGQFIWKTGMQRLGDFTIINLLTSYYVWGGVALYAIATVLWLKVLSLAPLSVAYPLQSIAYVLGIVVAYLLLGENIPITRWIGGIIIIIGVYFIVH
jgi:drug/metabolite transporter (DMT)-like permease